MQKNNTKTIIIKDPPGADSGPDIASDLLEVDEDPVLNLRSEIESKYGSIEDFTNIYLYRTTTNGDKSPVAKFDTLPDVFDIKENYGGGKYLLKIQWKDANGTRRIVDKRFLIEGDPIINAAPRLIAPASNGSAEKPSELDYLIKLKAAGLIPDANKNGSGEIGLIMKSIEANNAMILEMIKQKSTGGNDALVKVLLENALQKNTGELDTFQKFITLYNKMQPGEAAGDFAWLKDLAPGLIPVVLKMLEKKTPAPMIAAPRGPQLPARKNPGQIAAPAGDDTLKLLIAKLDALEFNLGTRLDSITARIEDIERSQNLDPELLNTIENMLEKETPGDVYKYLFDSQQVEDLEDFNDYLIELGEPPMLQNENNNITELTPVTVEENKDEMLKSIYKMAGNQIKAASEPERIATLKDYIEVKQVAAAVVFKFCLDAEVIKDITEFNEYMQKANLPLLDPQQITSETSPQ